MIFERVTLHGKHVLLEPLSAAHLDGLCEFGVDKELWRWTTTSLSTREEMIEFVETALKSEQEGTARPFATISRESGRVIGSTRFGNIDLENHMIVQDGRCRHSVYFSVIDSEWPEVKSNLEAKLIQASGL